MSVTSSLRVKHPWEKANTLIHPGWLKPDIAHPELLNQGWNCVSHSFYECPRYQAVAYSGLDEDLFLSQLVLLPIVFFNNQEQLLGSKEQLLSTQVK